MRYLGVLTLTVSLASVEAQAAPRRHHPSRARHHAPKKRARHADADTTLESAVAERRRAPEPALSAAAPPVEPPAAPPSVEQAADDETPGQHQKR